MKKLKRFLSFALCLTVIMSVSIPVLASDENPIEARDITVYFINAEGVNLRSGPGTQYSSGGLLFYGDAVTRYSLNDKYDSYGNRWAYVLVETGQCRGLYGYVLRTYISSKNVPGTGP